MAANAPGAAWRWVLTRSLWLYSVPNGSKGHVNQPAKDLNIRFNFLDLVARLTVHLSAMPAPENVLYFDEFLAVMDSDENWSLSTEKLYEKVLLKRVELKFQTQRNILHSSAQPTLKEGTTPAATT